MTPPPTLICPLTVDGEQVGLISAVRRSERPTGLARYDWYVYTRSVLTTGYLTHDPEDGYVTLLARVLWEYEATPNAHRSSP